MISQNGTRLKRNLRNSADTSWCASIAEPTVHSSVGTADRRLSPHLALFTSCQKPLLLHKEGTFKLAISDDGLPMLVIKLVWDLQLQDRSWAFRDTYLALLVFKVCPSYCQSNFTMLLVCLRLSHRFRVAYLIA